MPFVLDNSVVCGWLFENQADDYTEAVARRLSSDRAAAPVLWPMELANVLRTACRRGSLTAQQAQGMLEQLALLPIGIDPHPARPGLLLALALRFDLSACDATYLELALRLQQPIATRDAALADAARAAGVGTVG
ncbi:MAG: type II toxin-antitoxin system VapC family toxin [Xanthomonadaceae bacterium]|nr:type II toxin-antitoxin system VapC family toxin [Xanthomonadaceae bacterium]